mmetsp:Transcript_28554/g.52765  ORF Transcript_28554/g.52765 Transcript_28554/m.52765 type:complete len:262 (-) Transcript_28554:390-1175(-)
MSKFRLRKNHTQLELRQIFHHHFMRGRYIRKSHGSQSPQRRGQRQFVQLLEPRHGHTSRQPREPNLHQLLRIQRPMVIPATRHVSRQHHPGRVHRLEHSRVIDPPCDFLNEDGRQSFGTELLVHAQKVHLDHVLGLVVHADFGGDSRDERHETIGFAGAYAEVELFLEAGRGERPGEEVLGVVEAEHASVVLDVVFVEEVVDFFFLFGVGDVDLGPFEAFGHVVGILAEFGFGFVGDDGFVVGAAGGGFGFFVFVIVIIIL